MIATVPAVEIQRGDIIRFPEAPEHAFTVDSNQPLGVSTRRLALWDGTHIRYMDVAPGHPVTITGHKESS